MSIGLFLLGIIIIGGLLTALSFNSCDCPKNNCDCDPFNI